MKRIIYFFSFLLFFTVMLPNFSSAEMPDYAQIWKVIPEYAPCPDGYRKFGPRCVNDETKDTIYFSSPEQMKKLYQSAKLSDPEGKHQEAFEHFRAEHEKYQALHEKEEAEKKAAEEAKKAEEEAAKKAAEEEAKKAAEDAKKLADEKGKSDGGEKGDLSGQSVENKDGAGSGAKDGAAAGSTNSGNVEKTSFVGASSLGNDYGMGDCSGNIFQQLACRAGMIGSGLRSVAYMIAGFGLIVFSFAAIFGKVKWPLFATIMLCCFLLSATVFVVNMMTKGGDASWIGGVTGNGTSYSDSATTVPPTDSGGVPKGESPK